MTDSANLIIKVTYMVLVDRKSQKHIATVVYSIWDEANATQPVSVNPRAWVSDPIPGQRRAFCQARKNARRIKAELEEKFPGAEVVIAKG